MKGAEEETRALKLSMLGTKSGPPNLELASLVVASQMPAALEDDRHLEDNPEASLHSGRGSARGKQGNGIQQEAKREHKDHQSTFPIPVEHVYDALYSAGVCALICASAHIVASRVWKRILGPKRITALSERERLYLGEKTAATLNGLISGGLATYAVGSGSWKGDVVQPYPRTAHYALSFFAGFSLYDSVIMALSAREPPMMWIHHCYRRLAFFPLAFTITELTTIPFNLIWYSKLLGFTSASRLVRSLVLVRAVAFLIIRAPIGFTSVAYAHRQTKGGIIALWRRLFVREEVKPTFLPYGTAFNTILFSVLNLIWTAQALRANLKGSEHKRA
ncbi:SubName: Full=Uncharacterized protein {ECO:0000313/EMBL:CCA73503.1} [Serendipita indica DSM 11827]|nr:SubName: Full=Uncharacterized protein {ECO:0000313/EMBL:CCA73503.1} [Serendipita indica DSM 11827]